MSNIYVPMNSETGTTTGPNGKSQTRKIKAALIKAFGKINVDFHPNHYCCTAFIQFSKTNIIYLSVSDYRHFPNSYLTRTARNIKDYTGGPNNHNKDFNTIIDNINKLATINQLSQFVK